MKYAYNLSYSDNLINTMEENKPLSGKPVEPKKPAPTQEESIKIPAPVSK